MNEALALHKKKRGKIGVYSKVDINTNEDLSLAYTPGVALPCLEIEKDPETVYDYTAKGNTVAVITDGSAVLGLGDIGPKAAIPVMEGKSALFKRFADIDAIPLCVDTQDVDEFVNIVAQITSTFGGINLEDIAAPRCFEIERKLQERVDIPVFHDDQHGTAIVVCSALINALKLAEKEFNQIRVVINGAGAAGAAITTMLQNLGIEDILLCDRSGILNEKSTTLSGSKLELAKRTNRNFESGSLRDAFKGADVFIGVSGPNLVDHEMVASMADKAIVFGLANPTPEIMPEEAKKGNVFIMATGRSDFPNQINNILAFPGIFKGALAARASHISDAMKVAATYAIAESLDEKDLHVDHIIPSIFTEGITEKVAQAVAKAWHDTKQ